MFQPGKLHPRPRSVEMYITYTLQHMCFETCGLCNTFTLQYMHCARCALCKMCTLQHVHCAIGRVENRTRLGLKCQTSAFPLTIPKIIGLVLST